MSATDYDRIAAALAFLETHARAQPRLAEVAHHVHLSPYHFERLFKRWAGVTPKQFLQVLTLDAAKARLDDGATVWDAALDAGLSGGSRLHDHFVTLEAVTPGEYKRGGAGLTLRYGFHPTPFGTALLATTPRGLCHLAFLDAETQAEARGLLQAAWPEAVLTEDPTATLRFAKALEEPPARPLPLVLRGTNFQVQVWQALLRIPPGQVVAYDAVAQAIGRPEATRAVAQAIGRNAIGYLIPCHRVLRKNGALGGYRWGTVRKQAMLGREAVATPPAVRPTATPLFG